MDDREDRLRDLHTTPGLRGKPFEPEDAAAIDWAVGEIDRLRKELVMARGEADAHRWVADALRTALALKLAEDRSHQ